MKTREQAVAEKGAWDKPTNNKGTSMKKTQEQRGVSEMKKIIWWTVEVEWEDGTRETLSEIPNYVAKEVDTYLTEVEDERNGENE